MKRIILILTLLLSFNLTLKAKNYELNFFIAKKAFFLKNYEKADYYFNKIIYNNNPNNKIVKKSRIYLILIKYKEKKYKKVINNVKTYTKIYKNDKYIDYIKYINSIIYNNNINNSIYNILAKNKHKKDQLFIKKSYQDLNKLVNKINDIKLKEKIIKKIIIIKNNLIKNELHILNYYIKKRNFISLINRTRNIKTINLEKLIKYKIKFIKIKAYNELYKNNLSENLINNLKNEL